MRQYVVDAFTTKPFAGNPAAICLAASWPADDLMQAVARENRLSETAFLVEAEGQDDGVPRFGLRWFTPGGEIDLCGHATLASAYVVLRFVHPDAREVAFDTLSGELRVRAAGERLEMDFPAYDLAPVPVTDEMAVALGVRPTEAYMGRDLLCILPAAEDVRALRPDLTAVARLDGLLCHVSAAGCDGFDCVSRSFGPKLAVDEDPVCGSGHCHILPYWAARLGKADLVAYQASERGGVLYSHVDGNTVVLGGSAVLYSEGRILEG